MRGSNSIRLGLAIGWSLWVLYAAVAFATGNGRSVFALSSIAAHLRLLVVVPLMFICETWLDPQIGAFVRSAVESGLIPQSELPAFDRLARRLTRLRNSPWPDALSAAASMPLIAMGSSVFALGSIFDHDVILSLALIFDVTVFRFLVFRWVWRLCFWCWFLRRLSQLDLRLLPAHPDRAGGLGQLEIVQFQFMPLIAAISILLSSTHAEALARGLAPVAIIYSAAGYAIVIGIAIVLGPLLVFTPNLVRCRQNGFTEYMNLASRYVSAFHEKWIVAKTPDDLLGTADLQSLADLSNSVSIVREMRIAPLNVRLLAQVAIVAFIPILPLSLFTLSATELLQKILMRLLGG